VWLEMFDRENYDETVDLGAAQIQTNQQTTK
jgi:hypothetical protein